MAIVSKRPGRRVPQTSYTAATSRRSFLPRRLPQPRRCRTSAVIVLTTLAKKMGRLSQNGPIESLPSGHPVEHPHTHTHTSLLGSAVAFEPMSEGWMPTPRCHRYWCPTGPLKRSLGRHCTYTHTHTPVLASMSCGGMPTSNPRKVLGASFHRPHWDPERPRPGS